MGKVKHKSWVGKCFSCFYHNEKRTVEEVISACGIQTREAVKDPEAPINIEDYPYNTSVIRYKDTDGKVYDWAVSSMPTDDEEHLRTFMEKWMPWARFVSCASKHH